MAETASAPARRVARARARPPTQWLVYATVAVLIAIGVALQSTAPLMAWRIEAGVVTSLCVVALWWVLGFALRSDAAGFVTLALTIALAATVSRIKRGHLGEPLYPWDLLLVREATGIAAHYVPVIAWIGAAAGVVVLVAAIIRFRRGASAPWWLALLGAAGLAFVVTTSLLVSAPFPARNVVWDLPQNADYNGPLLAFVFNARALLLPRPGVTSAQARTALAAAHGAPIVGDAGKPDVVIVLSEAWMDVAALGSEMSACLAPHARQRFVSPTFGGGTANVEFELHTGYPLGFVPYGTMPYRMYIRRAVTSALPSTFRAQGYDTLGTHNFARTFWNRDRVYPLLGFDRFVALEDMPPRVDRGAFPDDSMMFDTIKRELNRESPKPRFIFAASMMNHGLYDGESRYPRRDPPSASVAAALDPAQQVAVGNYIAIAHDFEQMLCALMDTLAKRDRETVLVAFGDHWPTFGRDLAVFRELRIASGKDINTLPYAEAIRMHRTPLVAWSNRHGDLALGDGVVPSYGLGAEVMSHAGLPVEGSWALELAHYRQTLDIACCYRDKAGKEVDLRNIAGYDVLYRDAFDRVLAPSTAQP